MGQIKNIKLHIVTDIKVHRNTKYFKQKFKCGSMWYQLTTCYSVSRIFTNLFSFTMEEEVTSIRKHLEELENVLPMDHNSIELLEKKFRQSEAERQNLRIALEKTKRLLEEEHKKRINQEAKVEELTKALRKEYETIVMIRDVL